MREIHEVCYRADAMRAKRSLRALSAFLVPVIVLSLVRVDSAHATVSMIGRTFYGDTTNAGTYKVATLSDITAGAEVNGNATSSSNIAFITAAHAPTRDEFMIGHIKLNGNLDVILCTGGCDGTTDDTNQFTVTSVTGTQTCDTTFGACHQPFDLAYEAGSGRLLAAFGRTSTDGTINYCVWNGSAWSPTNCSTYSTFAFNGGSSVDTRWVRLIPIDSGLKTLRRNSILLLVADANDDLFAAVWNGSSFTNLSTMTTTLSTSEIRSFDGAWENGTGDAIVGWSEGTSATTTPFHYKKWTRGTSTWDGSSTSFGTAGASQIGHWVTARGSALDGSDHVGFMTSTAATIGDACATAGNCRGQPWIWDGSSMTRGNEWTTGEPVFAELGDVTMEMNGSFVEFIYSTSHGAGSDGSDTQTWSESAGFGAITDIPGAMGDDAVRIQLAGHPNTTTAWITGEDVDADCNGSLWDGDAAATWDATGCNSAGETALSPVSHTAQPSEGGPIWAAPIPYSPYTRNWRWYDDETSNDPSTGLNGAAENTTPTGVITNELVRLRMQFTERAGNGQSDARKKLEWTTDVPTDPDALWTEVKDATNTSAVWRYASIMNADTVCTSCDDNTAVGTTRLTGSTQVGAYITDKDAAGGSNMDHTALAIVEYDYPLRVQNPELGSTYYFRVYDLDQNMALHPRADVQNDCLSSGCAYPSITISTLLPPSQPTLYDIPFDNERLSDTTPSFEFTTDDPDGTSGLVYQFQWDDDSNLAVSPLGDRTSDNESGCSPDCFENIDDGGDTSPFTESERIRFTIQSALSSGTTYYWRVRAKDPSGTDEYGQWSTVRSFTVQSGLTLSEWHQTQDSQFDTNTLNDTETYGSEQVRLPSEPRRALLMYAEDGVAEPAYRLWNGTLWRDSGSALSASSEAHWIVLSASPTRGGEYTAVTIASNGAARAQVFDRSTEMWDDLQQLASNVGNTSYRGVAIAYESSSGDAIAVACDGDADPSYWVWDGSSWTGPTTIDLSSTGNCSWLRLAADPVSDEMILVAQDASLAYRAIVWNGSAWGNETSGPATAVSPHEGMAVEYEESGGQGVVTVANTTNNSFYWNSWNGSAWAGWTTQAIGNDFHYAELERDEGTDNMVLCYIDTDNDIGVLRWDGSAWSTFLELDTGGNADTNRPVDCSFETEGSRDGYIMAVYSDTAKGAFRAWNGTTWSGELGIAGVEDSATVQTVRTGVGVILSLFYDDASIRIDATSWDGTEWATSETLEDNPSVTASPFKEPYAMAAARVLGVGTILSGAVDYDWVSGASGWGEIDWTEEETNGSVAMQVYYSDQEACDTIVPDGALAGNSSGFTAGPVDISGLSTTTYNQICLRASLTYGGGTPYLQDWTVSWEEDAEPAGGTGNFFYFFE